MSGKSAKRLRKLYKRDVQDFARAAAVADVLAKFIKPKPKYWPSWLWGKLLRKLIGSPEAIAAAENREDVDRRVDKDGYLDARFDDNDRFGDPDEIDRAHEAELEQKTINENQNANGNKNTEGQRPEGGAV